jgi:hypothetical protein
VLDSTGRRLAGSNIRWSVHVGLGNPGVLPVLCSRELDTLTVTHDFLGLLLGVRRRHHEGQLAVQFLQSRLRNRPSHAGGLAQVRIFSRRGAGRFDLAGAG